VFQRAADSTGELAARYPRDGQRIYDHAQSVYWVGYIARQRGQVAQAEASFRKYQALAQQLVRLDPNNVDWRVETAYAGVNLGVVYLESSRSAPALKAFVDARDAWADIVAARPELSTELATTWGWIAKASEALGEFDGAIGAQRTKVAVLDKVPNAGKNRDVQQLLANASYEVGRLQLALGRYASAKQSAQDGLARFEVLVAADGANTKWLVHTTFARASLAEIEIALRERDAALADVERADADTARLLSTDDTRAKWSVALIGNLLLCRLALAAPHAPQRHDLEALLSAVKSAESGSKSLDSEQTRIASAIELALGDLLTRDAQPAAARAHWQAAAARLQAPAAGGELPSMTLLAQARLRLGATDDARALAKRIEASPYRHPTYADLRQRLAAAAGAAPVHP
jgi:tetratricopeptide (TPR) repeat protein